eukprot:7235255-Prorocentrum_lima.AAC.1
MTSSLVGSEMCIRDSWNKGHVKGRIALFVDDMLQTGAKASNMELLKALGCLLYTSDAADDM